MKVELLWVKDEVRKMMMMIWIDFFLGGGGGGWEGKHIW
jgi:hypothetical protein